MPAKKKHLPVQYTCQQCKKSKESTRHREVYTKDYMGPCGDSFCFASCDSPSCHPISASLCAECASAMEGKKKGPAGKSV